jgi:hypothetical protein
MLDVIKETRSFEKQQKAFIPGKKEFRQQENTIKEAKHIMECIDLISQNLVEKTKNYKKRINYLKLEEEIINKKQQENFNREELGLRVPNDEKQKLIEHKKKIDVQIAALEKEEKVETDKRFDQIYNYFKTFYTIKETSKLAEKQFRQALIVASTAFLQTATGKVTQGVEELIKNMLKLILEGKL